MRYSPYGPYKIPRGDDRYVLLDADGRRQFWEDVNAEVGELPDACGCYVFALRSGGGTKPWYVGKAERQNFKRECLTEDKILKYNSAISFSRQGTPLLYFYARITTVTKRFSKPSTASHRDISYLEKMLIGLALDRNKFLVNIQDTALLKNMVVHGLLNTPAGSLSRSAYELGGVLGY